jgi:ABC-type glycerol-3-phosphate transport system substrate-binding protein
MSVHRIRALVLALAFAASACGGQAAEPAPEPEPAVEEPAAEDTTAEETPAPEEAPSEEEIPLAEDFAEEVASAITAENLDDELAALEAELEGAD